MKGLAVVLLFGHCFLLSKAIISNQIEAANFWSSLETLDSDAKSLTAYTENIASKFKNERGVNWFFKRAGKSCGKNLKKAMESLQKHISKVQYIQIREGQRSQLTLLKRPLNSIDKATPAVTPNNFMKLEFGLRDLVSGMRKLAQFYHIDGLPNYSVGLGPGTTKAILKQKVSENYHNRATFKELVKIEHCLKVFRNDFTIPRIGYDPVENSFNDNSV